MATNTSTTNFGPTGFAVIERLGRGAVFEVALVRDVRGRDLICKRAAQPGAAGAIERERDILLGLKGVAVPELVASGADARGEFLVETRAPGQAVRALFAEGRPRLGAAEWIELARASAHALAALHAAADAKGALGFVHGDVSPDNLFFEAPTAVTFLDFSSALWRDAPAAALPGDRGTVPYAAPELLRQEAHATAHGDTYALAATLLAAAVGPPLVRATTEAGRLYEAASEGILGKRIEERTDLPPALRSALVEALQYKQAFRLSSSHDFAARFGPLSTPDPNRHE
jgi:serine/threonine protein kinase